MIKGIVKLQGCELPEQGYCSRTDGEGNGIVFYTEPDETGEPHLVIGKGPISLKEKVIKVKESRWANDKDEWEYGTDRLIESGLLGNKKELYDKFLN